MCVTVEKNLSLSLKINGRMPSKQHIGRQQWTNGDETKSDAWTIRGQKSEPRSNIYTWLIFDSQDRVHDWS